MMDSKELLLFRKVKTKNVGHARRIGFEFVKKSTSYYAQKNV